VLIGCTPQQLKIYLESKFLQNMSWENYGYRGWHVDHIIPLSSAKNYNDIYKLFHYTNLQPMWGIDNMIKGNKIKESESSNQQ
jgi:ABC-type proline/glycine betaine transport system substrate-binding protein